MVTSRRASSGGRTAGTMTPGNKMEKPSGEKQSTRCRGRKPDSTNPEVPGTQRPRRPGLFSCSSSCCCCPCSCDTGATRASSCYCCPRGCGTGATRGCTCCCCGRSRARCSCGCCCCCCCRREEFLGGDGGGAVAPEEPRGPAARELPWPSLSEVLWRFAPGSETRVLSPLSSLRRPASPDDAPELLCARLEPAATALLAAACFPFVVAPDPAALSVA